MTTAVRVIEPRQPGVGDRLSEVWRHRALIHWFGAQMLTKLYRRTWLGKVWVPLRPTLQIGSSVFVFGGLLGVDSGPVPYLVFLLCGMALWELFSITLIWGTRSLELARGTLRRMYVPRLTCLLGAVLIAGVLFAIELVFLALALAGYLVADGRLYLELGPELLLAVAGVALSVSLALAFASFTSVYAAEARDVRFVVNYLLGFWLFITPILYPLAHVPPAYETVMLLNPMTAPVELFRMGLLGEGAVPPLALASCAGTIAVVGGLGLRFFSRAEARALDAL